MLADIQYDDGTDEEYLACETSDGMIYKVEAANKNFVNDNFKKGQFKSGETDLSFPEDAVIDESTATIKSSSAPGLAKKDRESVRQRRNLATVVGDKTILAVRVIASDGLYGFTEAVLSDEVFGTSGDSFNLKSGYSQCSHGKLNMIKANDRTATEATISNGVVTITVATSTTEGDGAMRNAITAELNRVFGVSSPTALANHVMYCLPPNTMSGIAYAYINSWNSVYSNQWCNYPSGQIHELGHNLNMAHSNEAGTYRDQSGMMGFSYSQDEGPVMCFNAAKNYQFGWFSNRHLDMSASGTRAYTGELRSILDDPDVAGAPMIIKVDNGNNDYFIGFNRKAGFNSGTVEGGNQVMITQAGNGNNYFESELLSKLSAGGTFTFVAGGVNVVVTVNSINTSGNGFASISVCFDGDCSTPAPTTAAPTSAPTSSPTSSPTSTVSTLI